MSNPNRLRPRAQEMFARVEKYLASGLSQKAFCAQEAIAFTTFTVAAFQNWLKKYRARQRQVETLAAAPNRFYARCLGTHHVNVMLDIKSYK